MLRRSSAIAALVGLVALSCIYNVDAAGARPSGSTGRQQPKITSQVDPFCDAKSARVMILGTYHFANPGLDSRNVEADDVRTSRRQSELEALTGKLARFAPTKIMVEAPHGSPRVQHDYREYLAGRRQLTRNETEQIGFRLAKKLGHSSVYPIDFEMRMSGLRPDEVDDDWRPKRAATITSPVTDGSSTPKELSNEEKTLRASTITQTLLRMNNANVADNDHSANYMNLLLPEDSPAIYAQSDYLVNWYKRNIRMFANIARHTTFPDDNVLVLVGSGHLKIMRDLARDAPYFCLVEPASYLGS